MVWVCESALKPVGLPAWLTNAPKLFGADGASVRKPTANQRENGFGREFGEPAGGVKESPLAERDGFASYPERIRDRALTRGRASAISLLITQRFGSLSDLKLSSQPSPSTSIYLEQMLESAGRKKSDPLSRKLATKFYAELLIPSRSVIPGSIALGH
jgi:hypothetical protein